MICRSTIAIGSLILLTPAAANAQAFQVREDYPASARRYGHEGTAYYTVEVNEEGRAENCVITRTSGWQDLDEATCKSVTLRARFKPALDDTGKPVRGIFSARVVWKLSSPKKPSE